MKKRMTVKKVMEQLGISHFKAKYRPEFKVRSLKTMIEKNDPILNYKAEITDVAEFIVFYPNIPVTMRGWDIETKNYMK